jgi:peptide methionine sulfoxide reductase msrA/msrB
MYWRKLGLLIIFVAVACEKKLEAGAKDFSLPRPYVLSDKNLKVAVFAGGCFWCMEPPFEKLNGVKAVISGYAGGSEKNPTYEEVSYGRSSHVEAVLVVYDPKVVSYEKLLEVFWQKHQSRTGRRAILRSRPAVHDVYFLRERSRAEACRKIKGGFSSDQKVFTYRNPCQPSDSLLARRRLPSGLLQEKSRALLPLPHRVRQGCLY